MSEIALTLNTPRASGTTEARRVRRSGQIPGVIYGHGFEATAFSVDARDLRGAFTTDAGLNALLNVTLNGSSHLAVAKEVQHHPVRHTVTHIDLLIVNRDEEITAEVPVNIVGDAQAVTRGDGRVEQQVFTVTLRAVPASIPNSIEVDVTDLVIHGTIKLEDLKLPKDVKVEADPEVIVVIGAPPKVVRTPVEGETAEVTP
ncbi:MAG: 50S ribosomal protein L25 [Acidimicrobiales bacterium]|nr:50S ribosomal protein L25 [Acidimicrobiales bacterium]